MSNEELVKRIQAGETELLSQLMEQNRGIAAILARRYLPAAQRNRGVDFDDLMQAAAPGPYHGGNRRLHRDGQLRTWARREREKHENSRQTAI